MSRTAVSEIVYNGNNNDWPLVSAKDQIFGKNHDYKLIFWLKTLEKFILATTNVLITYNVISPTILDH